MKKLYIFDIDGTLADLTHRLHFIKQDKPDWDAFHDHVFLDTPIPPVISLCQELLKTSDVYFFTGRMDRGSSRTIRWLREHVHYGIQDEQLVMRADNDYRPDYVIKQQMYDRLLDEDKARLSIVFDDRDQVVNMWRQNGVKCLQVAPGDF